MIKIYCIEFSENKNIIQGGRGEKKEPCVFHLALIHSLSVFNLNGKIGTIILPLQLPAGE